MQRDVIKRGREELRQVRKRSRSLYWTVGLFLAFANLLMLTGPLYMLQVYDRVLGSGSQETLVALSLLVAFAYAVMGVLDYTRGRIMARVGARFQDDLDRRVFDAVVLKSAVVPDEKTNGNLADLEAVQRMITSLVLMAAFDLPWTPIFFAGIFVFHAYLGYFALIGGAILVVIAIANQFLSRGAQGRAAIAGQQASSMADQIRTEAEMVQAMGMREAAFTRWQKARSQALEGQVRAADVGGTFTSMTKTIRLFFLQSAMLGMGAYLVLQNELTPGAMIAGSILLGRALAPVEMGLNQWPVVQRGMIGWANIAELLGVMQSEGQRTELPKPRAMLVAKNLTVVPPGEKQASLKSISFKVEPGQAVGVIGTSGAGKSILARTLTGVWRPAGGSVRIDGAALEHYGSEVLGRLIGYLPQRV
jgi:ATP-binding cassette subfamily C protein